MARNRRLLRSTVKIEFKGGKELEAALKDLDISTARKRGVARRALDEAAKPIHSAWVGGVDVDSGDLKESIKIGNRAKTKATRKFMRGAGQDIVERFIGIDESVSPDLHIYAIKEEFGDTRQGANPAGRQAWEGQKQVAFDKIADALWAGISKVKK